MRKLTILFLALTLSVGLWANQITYMATEALTLGGEEFMIPFSSHAWSPDTQKGTITFDSDVTTITVNAFKGSKLISMTLPCTITTIMGNVFYGCDNLTSITFEGVATSFASDAFNGVGTAQAPITLILPEEWNYNAAPTDNQTAWHGGYFNSNIYSTQESTDKQAALDAINVAMGGHPESAYLQSLVAEYVTNITNATNRKTINTNRDAAIAILTPIVAIYPIAFNEGDAAGYAKGKADGYAEGKAAGYDEGKAAGYDEGKAAGYDEGKVDGYAKGKADGYDEGKADGYAEGKDDGYADGYADGKVDGYADGKVDGYADGKADGYTEGKADGKEEAFGTLGTKQNGPAVIVTGQDNKQIILYSPKKVQYIKVSDK